MTRPRATPLGLALAAAVTAAGCPGRPMRRDAAVDARDASSHCPAGDPALDVPAFHGNAQRHGWNPRETALTPAAVASPDFGPVWSSPQFDSVVIAGREYAPHVFTTPLYLDRVRVSAGQYAERELPLVFVGTTNGYVYAVAAADSDCDGPRIAAGTIVWRAQLVEPVTVRGFDGGLPLGVLATPVIDREADPPRLYVTGLDRTGGWNAFALDVRSGRTLQGWPAPINDATLGAVNRNGPARFGPAPAMSQRAALALSPDRARLYLGFAAFTWDQTGWTVAIDTQRAAVAHAFASAPAGERNGRGGIWGVGGPAVPDDGAVYLTTGNGLPGTGPTPGHWADSLLRFDRELALTGTYSPFNYCTLDERDMDLGGSSPLVFDLDPAATSTPRLIAFGSKQGAVYLLDRDALPGRLDARPPCNVPPASDGSLLPPEDQPQFGSRGPLQVFRPYSRDRALYDHARMHTTLALFRDAQGGAWLYATGASKQSETDATSVPPGVFRLRVQTSPGAPAHLAIDAAETATRLWNPGSPWITSNGPDDAVLWVLDANQPRSARLVDLTRAARPILYAFDARTLELLYRSPAGELFVGGKYVTPTAVRGTVFVATDRLQAFGVRAP